MGQVGKTLEQLSELRKRAERKARQNIEALRGRPVTKAHELVHELQVHQIELEMQNEELRRTHLELDGLREKYFDLFDLAPVGYFTLDIENLIEESNLTGAELLGVDRRDLKKIRFSQFIAPDSEDVFYLHNNKVRETRGRQICELRLRRRPGGRFDAQLISAPCLDADGNFNGLRIAVIDITERKKAEREHLEYQAKLKSMASRLSRAEELERRKLSVRLHDSISQSLAMAKLSLQKAAEGVTDRALADKLDEISTEIRRIIENSYSLMLELSNPILYELGLVAALKALLESGFLQDEGVRCELRACQEPLGLDRNMQVTVYQAVRELMANSAKHAKAANIKVLIEKKAACLRISVRDDGIGFDESSVRLPGSTGGFGLFNVRESLEGIGGALKIECKPGRGTAATITVPLKSESKV